jgi:hypothetical protein
VGGVIHITLNLVCYNILCYTENPIRSNPVHDRPPGDRAGDWYREKYLMVALVPGKIKINKDVLQSGSEGERLSLVQYQVHIFFPFFLPLVHYQVHIFSEFVHSAYTGILDSSRCGARLFI